MHCNHEKWHRPIWINLSKWVLWAFQIDFFWRQYTLVKMGIPKCNFKSSQRDHSILRNKQILYNRPKRTHRSFTQYADNWNKLFLANIQRQLQTGPVVKCNPPCLCNSEVTYHAPLPRQTLQSCWNSFSYQTQLKVLLQEWKQNHTFTVKTYIYSNIDWMFLKIRKLNTKTRIMNIQSLFAPPFCRLSA